MIFRIQLRWPALFVAIQQSKKSQFYTPDTFKGLTLRSHCYGGCAIFLPAYLRFDAYRILHSTQTHSLPVASGHCRNNRNCMQIDLESEKTREIKIIRMLLRMYVLNCEHTLMYMCRKIRLFAVKYIYKIRRKAGA